MASDRGEELSVYLSRLWRSRWLVAAATVAAGVLAWAGSLLMSPVFRAAGTLMLVESKVSESAPLRPGGDYQAVQEIVRELIENRDSARQIIGKNRDLHMTRYEAFRAALRIQTLPFSPLIRVSFDAGSPELAESVLTEVLERAVALNQRLNSDELTESRELLQAQVDASLAQVAAAERAVLEFDRTARMPERREMTYVLLERRRDLLKRLDEAVVTQAGAAAEQAALTKQFDPAVVEARRRLVRASGKLAESGAEAERVRAELAELDRTLIKHQAEFAEKDVTKERLAQALKLAKRTQSDFAARLDEVRLQVASRAPAFRVINPAGASRVPVFPRPLLNAAAAALASCIIAVALALIVGTDRRPSRRAGEGVSTP